MTIFVFTIIPTVAGRHCSSIGDSWLQGMTTFRMSRLQEINYCSQVLVFFSGKTEVATATSVSQPRPSNCSGLLPAWESLNIRFPTLRHVVPKNLRGWTRSTYSHKQRELPGWKHVGQDLPVWKASMESLLPSSVIEERNNREPKHWVLDFSLSKIQL